MTAWNDFVKKIYHEGHDKDPNYQFINALKDASKRKGEMGASTSAVTKGKTAKKSRKSRKSRKKGVGTKKRRRRR